ncbi:hypothetical protein ACEPPN_000998 [Leptodophora sp. 'Broadleaf-Isolate-01']
MRKSGEHVVPLKAAKKKKDAKKALKAAPALKRVTTAALVTRACAPRVKGDERLVIYLGYINGAL